MASPTLYDLLDVEANATAGELRAAKRATLKAVHPDRAAEIGLDEARLAARTKAVLEACEVLLDRRRRADYDAQIGLARSRRLRLLQLALIEWSAPLRYAKWWAGLGVRRQPTAAASPALRSPRLARPHLTAPELRIGGRTGAAIRLAHETRLGQWMIVVVVSSSLDAFAGLFIPWAHGVTLVGSTLVLGLWIGRAGAPTPLADARIVMLALARSVRALYRLLWSQPRSRPTISAEQ